MRVSKRSRNKCALRFILAFSLHKCWTSEHVYQKQNTEGGKTPSSNALDIKQKGKDRGGERRGGGGGPSEDRGGGDVQKEM